MSITTPSRQRRGVTLDSFNSTEFPSTSIDDSPECCTIDEGSTAGSLTGLYATLYDEELFNHYMTTTYLSISNKSSIQEAYRTAIPEEALSHEHLMHAMLGFSAAHLMHTRLDHRDIYESKARRHQHLGEFLSLRAIPKTALSVSIVVRGTYQSNQYYLIFSRTMLIHLRKRTER